MPIIIYCMLVTFRWINDEHSSFIYAKFTWELCGSARKKQNVQQAHGWQFNLQLLWNTNELFLLFLQLFPGRNHQHEQYVPHWLNKVLYWLQASDLTNIRVSPPTVNDLNTKATTTTTTKKSLFFSSLAHHPLSTCLFGPIKAHNCLN